MAENQLAERRKTIVGLLEQYKGQFALALPKLLTPERFTRIAITAINKNPKLLGCTQESLLGCLLDLAALGIEADGRRAHLIPYGDKCTLILDYKGIAELVRRSGEISTLHCGIVYPADDFDYAFGTGQFLKHKPSFDRAEGVKPLCVYSYVKLKDGEEDFDVMSIADVEKIRGRSRAANNGPWVSDFDEMAKKTVFRRHSKWLPLSPELRGKIEIDDEPITEQERFAAARDVTSQIEVGAAMPDGVKASDPSERRGRGRPKKPDPVVVSQPVEEPAKQAPERATPFQTLQNLMTASAVSEAQLIRYLESKAMCGEGDSLYTLRPEVVDDAIENWIAIGGEIKNG